MTGYLRATPLLQADLDALTARLWSADNPLSDDELSAMQFLRSEIAEREINPITQEDIDAALALLVAYQQEVRQTYLRCWWVDVMGGDPRASDQVIEETYNQSFCGGCDVYPYSHSRHPCS